MVETRDCAREQTTGLTYILQNLGFTLNEEKVILAPTQKLEFLGFGVDTVAMELRLPGDKLKKIRAEARKFLGTGSVIGAGPSPTNRHDEHGGTSDPTSYPVLLSPTARPRTCAGSEPPKLRLRARTFWRLLHPMDLTPMANTLSISQH